MANQMAAGGGSSMQFAGQQQPPAFGVVPNAKIFVGGLAWETRSETLRRYFEQFGDIIEAVVITDKHTGRSKGYGFVTFGDAEAAKRACTNPNPVIDGRRANCNLASTARPARILPYGNLRSPASFLRSPRSLSGPYMGNPIYQLPISYGYQSGLPYSPYRYPAYGLEYLYPQMYGIPGTASPSTMLYSQLGNPPPTNFPYRAVQTYVIPGSHMLQYGRPVVCGVATEVIPVQTPYHSGFSVPTPGPSQVVAPTGHPQFTPGSGSDQMAG